MGSRAVSAPYRNKLTGESPPMLKVREMIRKVGDSRVAVVIQGETGTGKELVARAIHATKPQGEFVPIDCASLAPTLIESELFGHERGAFTGALASRIGLLQTAHGGTAFLDEIGELPLESQAKLLRVLQQQEVRPLGSNQARPCNFRTVSATNRDLEEEVRCGRFRQDLYFRLNVVTLELPSLSARTEDIPCLVEDFLQKNGYTHQITPEVLEVMMSYSWPGNIRELENCVHRLVALSSDGYLHTEDLQFHSVLADSRTAREAELKVAPPPTFRVSSLIGKEQGPYSGEALSDLSAKHAERAAVERALSMTNGNTTAASQLLGMSRTTIYRKLKGYGKD